LGADAELPRRHAAALAEPRRRHALLRAARQALIAEGAGDDVAAQQQQGDEEHLAEALLRQPAAQSLAQRHADERGNLRSGGGEAELGTEKVVAAEREAERQG